MLLFTGATVSVRRNGAGQTMKPWQGSRGTPRAHCCCQL